MTGEVGGIAELIIVKLPGELVVAAGQVIALLVYDDGAVVLDLVDDIAGLAGFGMLECGDAVVGNARLWGD